NYNIRLSKMTSEEIRHKIDYEIIVDCYDDYEVNMGWYYFFEEALEFPFEAEINLKTRNGKTNLTKVDVLGIATEEGNFDEINEISLEVSPKGSETTLDVVLSKLKNLKANQSVIEAFEIWNFWKSGKY
ncbi:MAG: calcium-binding protein, partial [Bacteroidota bacterium]